MILITAVLGFGNGLSRAGFDFGLGTGFVCSGLFSLAGAVAVR